MVTLILLAGCSSNALYRDSGSWGGTYGTTTNDGTGEDWSTSTPWSDTTSTTPPTDTATTGTSDVCDDAVPDPVTYAMSADDSNSQAGAALARALIEDGQSIRSAMRSYEFLNYYDFAYPPATEGHVSLDAQARDTGDGKYEVLFAVVGPHVDQESRRPINLTFSADTSGSMSGQGLSTSQAVMRAAASSLREGDIVSIVTWSSTTEVVLDSHVVDGPDDTALLDAIESMSSAGSTDLSKGLEAAYSLADANYSNGRTNRVVLISDGGANTGVTDEELIGNRAEDHEGEGTYLIGVGAGKATSYADGLMDTVTDLGKGAYVYVDGSAEAEKMFTGDRFVSNVEIAARNVRLSVSLPPNWVVADFHGEQISTNPDAVTPQNLAPNDAMLYYLELQACDTPTGNEEFALSADWEDPSTGVARSDAATTTLAAMTAEASTQVLKAEALVAYAEGITAVWGLAAADRQSYMAGVRATVAAAAAARPDDADLEEVLGLIDTYSEKF